MNIWTAYAMMWISFAGVTITGIIISDSLTPLWIMVIPMFSSVSSKGKE